MIMCHTKFFKCFFGILSILLSGLVQSSEFEVSGYVEGFVPSKTVSVFGYGLSLADKRFSLDVAVTEIDVELSGGRNYTIAPHHLDYIHQITDRVLFLAHYGWVDQTRLDCLKIQTKFVGDCNDFDIRVIQDEVVQPAGSIESESHAVGLRIKPFENGWVDLIGGQASYREDSVFFDPAVSSLIGSTIGGQPFPVSVSEYKAQTVVDEKYDYYGITAGYEASSFVLGGLFRWDGSVRAHFFEENAARRWSPPRQWFDCESVLKWEREDAGYISLILSVSNYALLTPSSPLLTPLIEGEDKKLLGALSVRLGF